MKRIGDIKKYERCDKYLWLSHKEPLEYQSFALFTENIYDLVKEKFQIKECFEGKTGDDNEAFFSHVNDYNAFFKVRFTYNDFRIRIPFMMKELNGYHIYFLYASCYPKESEAKSFSDQCYVLEHLNIPVSNVSVIHLNANYVRGDTLDVHELLVVDDCLFNVRNHKGKTILSLMDTFKRDVEPILKAIDETLSKDDIGDRKRTNICTRRMKCPYFNRCFNIEVKDTSVLNLVSSSKKFDLLDRGIKDLKDIDFEMIEGTRHQYAQVIAAKTNEMFFDAISINAFIKQIQYPISYLDFEWQTFAYPPYKGMKPYDVLTFQYSLHIENKEENDLIHKEYLGMHDCREEFIIHLLEDVPKEGSILCYNVEGAEKLRLTQLAEQFPQYKEDLQQIWERMIDLSIPFSLGCIYDNRMAGMYSLKKLVSIFTDYDYADLDISQGMEAVFNYRMLDEENRAEQEKTRQELLQYCAMDTYAEYLIYHFVLDELEKRK